MNDLGKIVVGFSVVSFSPRFDKIEMEAGTCDCADAAEDGDGRGRGHLKPRLGGHSGDFAIDPSAHLLETGLEDKLPVSENLL